MRKTMYIGGVPVELEANLGTAALFQEFTGKNLLETSSLISKPLEGVDLKGIDLNLSNEELLKNESIIKNIGSFTTVINEMVDVAKRLAFVMNIQTKYGKTREDISKIRKELTEDDLLAWSFNFCATAFTAQTYMELMAFWRGQSEKTSEQKNQ